MGNPLGLGLYKVSGQQTCPLYINISDFEVWSQTSACKGTPGSRYSPFYLTHPIHTPAKDSHYTGNFMPYSFRIVCGFFNAPHWTYKHGRYCESLTICWCNYKGSTFYSVILRPWVFVRPELNSRPPALQPNAQLTEPPVRSLGSERVKGGNNQQRQLFSSLPSQQVWFLLKQNSLQHLREVSHLSSGTFYAHTCSW